MIQQEKYMRMVADLNYEKFYEQGFATAGHNGPHGHVDTPVRNTSHYLIIYTYLYKKLRDEKYLKICRRFADYLCECQSMSKSGAIKCMESDLFDHLNGLIGQGWVIEALIYYYEVSHDEQCLEAAKRIFFAQEYDWKLHLWHRIELNGDDIGIDPTYNHHVWFAACSYKLNDYCEDNRVDEMIRDFLTNGVTRDFRVHNDGVLFHHVCVYNKIMRKTHFKNFVKLLLTPLQWVNPKKLDPKYMEYAYHIFDLYGFCILKERYLDLPFFDGKKYHMAEKCAHNVEYLNEKNGVYKYLEEGIPFNAYGYSYNSFAFEYPYVAKNCGFENSKVFESLFEMQKKLMWDDKDKMFTKNQPDIETWNARCYEIIRFLE